jgi:retron-type reverse transcriptase
MPKTHNQLWDAVVSFDNLYAAYIEARDCKRYRPDVLRFTARLEENLINIQNHLIWRTWTPSPWQEFMVYDPKRRLIQAPCFCDRVVHHALCRVTGPLFDKKQIYDSHACRVGRGTHSAVARVQKYLRAADQIGPVYVLQGDISKYFQSINHAAAMRIIARTISDQSALWMWRQVIYNSGFDVCGIPVGALTSQVIANLYLDRFDHYIKDDLGIKGYVRYMDDTVIVANDKRELRHLLERIRDFLATDLSLRLNPKTAIYPATQGVDFCGYRIWKTHILPRKRTVKKFRHKMRRMIHQYARGEINALSIQQTLASWMGYIQHCDGHRTTLGEIERLRWECEKCGVDAAEVLGWVEGRCDNRIRKNQSPIPPPRPETCIPPRDSPKPDHQAGHCNAKSLGHRHGQPDPADNK